MLKQVQHDDVLWLSSSKQLGMLLISTTLQQIRLLAPAFLGDRAGGGAQAALQRGLFRRAEVDDLRIAMDADIVEALFARSADAVDARKVVTLS